jgi:hypothetical protein
VIVNNLLITRLLITKDPLLFNIVINHVKTYRPYPNANTLLVLALEIFWSYVKYVVHLFSSKSTMQVHTQDQRNLVQLQNPPQLIGNMSFTPKSAKSPADKRFRRS